MAGQVEFGGKIFSRNLSFYIFIIFLVCEKMVKNVREIKQNENNYSKITSASALLGRKVSKA